ncbi:MAG: sigma-70 family RNA polymerase sigma factor [Bryobacterales bacterium]|nr:sigma-70 family RNA polymerase sigma factor [Bryobacterales bacterium]
MKTPGPATQQELIPGSALNESEADLIRAAQAGDSDAFEMLVRSYDRGVLRIAVNLLRSPEDAADVYQEAFVKVYKNLHSFRFDCSFQSWLYRIVTNSCLDLLRKRKIRKEEAAVVETGDGAWNRTEMFEESRSHGDPDRVLKNKHLHEEIRRSLESLTQKERMVFELRHFQGMRLRMIGEVLGTSEEAAKTCLFRATQKMRVALGSFL